MNIEYNVISLINTLGLLHGIIFGLLLIVATNKKRSTSTFLLGIFILAYALDLLPAIIEDLGLSETHPYWSGIPLDFGWLLFPLFYVYVQQISVLSKEKVSYWTLIPGLLVFVMNCVLFFLKLSAMFQDTIWYFFMILGEIFFSIFVGFKTVFWIRRHIEEIKNQYSSTEHKELQWAKIFVWFGLVFTFVAIACDIFGDFYTYLIISLLNIALLYWVSIRGILQKDVLALISIESNSNRSGQYYFKNDSEEITQNLNALFKKIDLYVRKEEIYTQPELSILDIANQLKEHPKQISRAINSYSGQNFNSYINTMRIQKAIVLLESEKAKNLSIEGLALEVGFLSRSSFYLAFKKVTGTTPTNFKNS